MQRVTAVDVADWKVHPPRIMYCQFAPAAATTFPICNRFAGDVIQLRGSRSITSARVSAWLLGTAREWQGVADLNRGYIKLWRKVDKNPVWTQLAPAVYKVFTGCLLRANWKEMTIYNGSEQVTVPRGAFLTSLQDLATYCNVTRDQARGAIDHLEGMEFVSTHRLRTGGARLGLFVTIRNYEKYQVPSDSQNTVEARSGPIEPPLKNTVGTSGKEVFIKFKENKKQTQTAHTPAVHRNGDEPAYDPTHGWEQFERGFPTIRKMDLCYQQFVSVCTSVETERAILAGVVRYLQSAEVKRGVITSGENWLRDRMWEGKFMPSE